MLIHYSILTEGINTLVLLLLKCLKIKAWYKNKKITAWLKRMKIKAWLKRMKLKALITERK